MEDLPAQLPILDGRYRRSAHRPKGDDCVSSDSLPLLEPSALVAFLPAWLLRFVETIRESVLAEFTMYFLCPVIDDEGWDVNGISDRMSLLDSVQRSLIEDFLRSIVNCNGLQNWHPYAKEGLKRWSA
jgi:hypothetical protein